jgi:membrane protein YdbS with pleckstrin-like domain
MTFALIFWILMLLWLVFGLWGWYSPNQPYWVWGNGVFLFILFLLLGWHVFGAPVHP